MISIGDYNTIMSDRNIFNQIVYTPLSEALRLLEERQKDPVLMAKIENILKGNIPEILKHKKCGVICRQIATPNNETRMFVSIVKDNNLFPVLLEYHNDKFTSNNAYKHSLGVLHVGTHNANREESAVEKINIIDFNLNDGKKFKDISTLWGDKLVDFHRNLFHKHGMDDLEFQDVSVWLKDNGGDAVKYYTNLLILFICHGILFENFLISKDKEGSFTQNIVLPAIEKAINLTGVKPLIVPLEPLDLEADDYWLQHLSTIKENIPKH